MNKKMEEVKEANVRVVSEDFLQDISSSTKTLQELLSVHILSTWGAEVKTEPVEAAAPKAKSGAVASKKSKGPAKEEGESLQLQESVTLHYFALPWLPPQACWIGLCGASVCCLDLFSRISSHWAWDSRPLGGVRQYIHSLLENHSLVLSVELFAFLCPIPR